MALRVRAPGRTGGTTVMIVPSLAACLSCRSAPLSQRARPRSSVSDALPGPLFLLSLLVLFASRCAFTASRCFSASSRDLATVWLKYSDICFCRGMIALGRAESSVQASSSASNSELNNTNHYKTIQPNEDILNAKQIVTTKSQDNNNTGRTSVVVFLFLLVFFVSVV